MRSTSGSFEQVFPFFSVEEQTMMYRNCGNAVLTGTWGVFLPSPSTGNPTEMLLHR